MRLKVPNSTSFSRVRKLTAPNPPIEIQARHVHQLIMIQNEAASSGGNPLAYFTYNAGRYANFDTDFSQTSCPTPSPSAPYPSAYHPETRFDRSPIDNQTLIDHCNPKLAPVFANNLYLSFGLGERRCPGENFVSYYMLKQMNKFQNVTFGYKPIPSDTPLVTVAPFSAVKDDIFVTAV